MTTYQDYSSNFFTDSPSCVEATSQKLVKKLMDLIVQSDFREVNNLFLSTKVMRYSAQGYLQTSDIPPDVQKILTQIGYTSALMDVMQLYTEKLHYENEIQKIKTGYRDYILSVLAKQGTMLHKDLAASIGVSASGLTAIIKHMNDTSVKLIAIEQISKYKLYSLTPAAFQYINEHNTAASPPGNTQIKKITITYKNLKACTTKSREIVNPIRQFPLNDTIPKKNHLEPIYYNNIHNFNNRRKKQA